MAIVERKITNRSGVDAPLDGVYYPKPSYALEPYFQEIDGEMHFLMQPWMKTICFDDSVYEWTANASLLQDVCIAPPKDDATGWNVGDKITLKFYMNFEQDLTDLVYFGYYDESIWMDNITMGGDEEVINDGQINLDYSYGLYEYYPLLSDSGYSDYNTFEFHKIGENTTVLGEDATLPSILLKSYVYALPGEDVYDIVYPY
jgi:hypothetical protein